MNPIESNQRQPTSLPSASPGATPGGDETVAAIIPFRNWPALTAYYLGIFSLFPLIGLLLAVPAFVLGIMGYRRYLADRRLKGNVHAWIGIICGAIFTLVWGGVSVLMIIAMIAETR